MQNKVGWDQEGFPWLSLGHATLQYLPITTMHYFNYATCLDGNRWNHIFIIRHWGSTAQASFGSLSFLFFFSLFAFFLLTYCKLAPFLLWLTWTHSIWKGHPYMALTFTFGHEIDMTHLLVTVQSHLTLQSSDLKATHSKQMLHNK